MYCKLSSLLVLLLLSHFLFAQRNISGKVTDAGDGSPLIGATVLIAGSSNIGTTTDVDGFFSFSGQDDSISLVVSYTGYRTLTVDVTDQEHIQIALDVSTTTLDEVTVIGYGTQIRSKITGAVSSLKSDDIQDAPVNSLESVIQGQSAGVLVTKASGKLGEKINVRIRGTASINANSEPLYVIDGIVMTDNRYIFTFGSGRPNPLADVNINDIESITILKDAAATAIYGARGSNGVVLITTKQGKASEAKIELDVNTGWSDPTRTRSWLNGEQYLELWDEAFSNVADENGTVFGSDAEDWKNSWIPGWDQGYDTDWEDLAFDEGASYREVQLSASGGSEKTRYYVSANSLDQTGILKGNALQRLGGRLNLSHQTAKKLDFGMKLSMSRTINDRVYRDFSFAGPIAHIAMPPAQPAFDPDNPEEPFQNTIYPNPLLALDHSEFVTKIYSALGNLYYNWKPVKNLTIHSDLGIDFKTQDDDLWQGVNMVAFNGEPNGYAFTSFRTVFNYVTTHYATYVRQMGTVNMDGTLGMSLQKSDLHYNRVAGRNFPNDDFKTIQSAAEIFQGREWENGWRNLSYFGRFNFDFLQKYLISFSFRYDGDSRFGTDNRYGFFPALSVGWVLSDESFIQELNSLSYLKIRASLGLTGNTPNDDFPYQGLFDGFGKYAGFGGIVQSQLANPALQWEKTRQINVGLELGLFNDRIFGQVELYRNRTRDLLLAVNVPMTSGFTSQIQNAGKMRNSGFEFSLKTYNLTGSFKWQTNLNLARNENEITDLRGQVLDPGNFRSGNQAREGYPIGVFFWPEYAGVDPDNGDPLYYRNTELDNGERDRSTTNNLNEAELVAVGDPNPDWIFGMTNTLRWKGFTLETMIQGVEGNQIYNLGAFYQLDGFSWFDNQDSRILDRWQKPGDQTEVPQLRFLGGNNESSRFIEEGSYIRLKKVSLHYNFSHGFAARLGLEKLQVYFSSDNLITITRYNGWDPEVNTNFIGNIRFGIDFYSAPQMKTFVLGLKAGF